MNKQAVLLDTSFFLRFLKESDPLFNNADSYYKYFLNKNIDMVISTIAIAEYCVGGNINELPLKDIQILPFNIDHAKRAGEFAKVVFNNKGSLKLQERNIIPNDSKLFAQADFEKGISFYLSSDTESSKIYNLLKNYFTMNFQFLDLSQNCLDAFGELDLK
ncbi:MAG: PIN domain-containing protein [Ignavibacteriaceae bacterium]|nr:PIN domain-containing protein [Ignavibacteriaceae bacterium]